MSHDDYASDDDDDLGLSAMMAHAVTSSTSGGGREGRLGRDRDDEKTDRSRSRSSSIFRRNKKDVRDKNDCAPSTPKRRGRSRDFDLIDHIGSDNDKNKNKRDVGRSRSRSVLRKIKGLGQKNTATTTTNAPIPATRSGEDDSVVTTGMNMTTTTKTTATKNTSNNNKSKVERTKSSSKKKHKKIKRITNADANDDDDDDNDDTCSRRSCSSKKATKNKKKKPSKEHHSNKTTTSRIESIRGPILTSEGAVIKEEMENLFPSPKSSHNKKVVMVEAPTTTTMTTGTPTVTIVSSESIDLTPRYYDDCDDRAAAVAATTITQHASSIRPELLVQIRAQESHGSGSGSGSGSSNFGCGIMSNKAAQEQAEAALNRVAAHQVIEKNNNNYNNSINSFGSSIGSGMDVDISPTLFNRRIGNTNSGDTGSSSRRNEQFQRLHRDSGLSSVGDDESCRSRISRRSNIKGNNMNNMIVSGLHRQLDEHKVENVDLQKLLSKALTKIEQLNDELRIDKDHSKTTKDDLSSVQSKLGRTEREKRFLIECVRDMEDDFVAKDERIEKLQNVVETQLDTVEYLEEQLYKTEEEVLLMEDELNALIFAVEKKKEVTEERVSERVSNNEGSHASNKQGRFARVGSIREDMVNRKNSIKMRKAESRRLLFNESVITESSRRNCPSSTHSSSGSHDVDERENKLQLRELKLEADREECSLREERLDRLERDLLVTDNNNNNNNKVTNERGTSQAEHSERNDVVSELTVAPCSLEPEKEEVSQLIASLQKEKENLHAIQIEDSEKLKKLKAENEDLRVKFDHFRGTTSLQENLSQKSQNDGCDEEGKDLLIRELQNQLVASKLEAHQFSSGSYVTKLKFEIKTLKQNIRDLKNNVKKEECILKSQLKKKDDSIKLIEKQMQKLKIEIERRDKRDKNLGTDQILSDVALQHHIEDLEEEIFHWKSAHADLENEIETMKSRSDEMDGIYQDDVNADGVEDDCSIGSVQSLIPQIEMPMNMSQDDLFFVSNSDSMSSISGIPPLQNEEPATQSTRAMRTVSSLWSKMTTGVEPTNSNPAIPYATGMLNDE